MKVALRDIPCHKHVELPAQFVGDAVAGLPIRAVLERPADDPAAGGGSADVDLYIEGENVFVRGHMDAWVEVACSRCVGVVKLPIKDDLFVTFMPAARMPASVDDADSELADGAEEPAVAEDDLDLYPYEGDDVDLAPLFRDQIVLAVPYAPLCDEDCKGLCSVCGTDLNTTSCDCDRAVIDPRWTALKTLKNT
jgi:uncharacterized protein